MQSRIRITQDERTEWRFDLSQQPAMDKAEAHAWLDAQFIALGSEPLRPTGKLLHIDKVLVIARDAGPRLLNDADWGQNFARATSATLGHPTVHIDLAAMTVTY